MKRNKKKLTEILAWKTMRLEGMKYASQVCCINLHGFEPYIDVQKEMSRDQRISENLSPILREKIITIFGGQKWWKSRAWDFLGVITVYFIFTSLKFPCILLQAHRLHDLSPLYTHTVPVSLSREKNTNLYYSPLMLIFLRTTFFISTSLQYCTPNSKSPHPHVAFTSLQ